MNSELPELQEELGRQLARLQDATDGLVSDRRARSGGKTAPPFATAPIVVPDSPPPFPLARRALWLSILFVEICAGTAWLFWNDAFLDAIEWLASSLTRR